MRTIGTKEKEFPKKENVCQRDRETGESVCERERKRGSVLARQSKRVERKREKGG